MNVITILAPIALYKYITRPKTSIVIVKDDTGKVLLLRRSRTDSWMPDHWALPGGHLDFLETGKMAGKRELREETNLEAKNLKRINIDIGTSRDAVFFAKDWAGRVNLKKASHGFEHSDFMWIYPDKITGLSKVVPILKRNKIINFLNVLG